MITWRRGRWTPSTFMVSALARIFRGSDVFVTPSISLLISAKTWLRKMFLMYTVRNSRRGHCLAGPSPRACSISWINLEDKQSTATVKRTRKIATEIWPNTGISACCHGEICGNYQNSKQGQTTLISTYIWVCFLNTSYFTYSIEIGWNRNKNFKLVGRKEKQRYLLIQEGNKNIKSKRKCDKKQSMMQSKEQTPFCIFLKLYICVDRTCEKRENKGYCCLVSKSCVTLCDPIDCSMPGSSVLFSLSEVAQIHVPWVGDAI